MDRRRRQAQLAVLLVVASAGVACRSHVPAPPPRGETPEAYRVGAPDTLQVIVLPEPAITEEVVVRPDGMITIQLVGDVQAGGRTLDQIALDVEERISRFKRGAKVTVKLTSALHTDITVLGEIRAPGTFPLVKETRIAEAIGQVGGPTVFASKRKIRVIRTGGGETVVYAVDLDAIQGGDLRTNIMLAPGDIVFVPPTVLAQIGYAINSVLFPIQPLLGLATGIAANVLTPGR